MQLLYTVCCTDVELALFATDTEGTPLSPWRTVTGTDLKWTASRNDLEREINAEKARTDLRGSPHAAGDDLKTEERRLAERLNKLRLDMYTMGGDGSCQVR